MEIPALGQDWLVGFVFGLVLDFFFFSGYSNVEAVTLSEGGILFLQLLDFICVFLSSFSVYIKDVCSFCVSKIKIW